MYFLKWYKHIVESAQEEPPESVWEGIQDELDVDAVWSSIEQDLPVTGRKRVIPVMAAAASILLIIGAGTFFYLAMHDQSSMDFIVHSDHTPDSVLINHSGREPSVQTSLTATLEFPGIRHIKRAPEIPYLQTTDHITPEREGFQPLPYLEYKPDLQEHGLRLADRRFSLTGEETGSHRTEFATTGYYAGLSGHLANTWLVNNKTMQGLRPDEFIASLPSFGYSIGITAGKNISKSLDIQLDVHFIYRIQQNYNEYLHGKYIYNNMQFNYSSLSLSGRWYFKERETPGRHSVILGAYTGILRNAVQYLNGETISLRQDYNSIDFGVIAGYEYHYRVGNGFSLGTGFQTRYGLNNIFSGNELIPDYLNITRNASVNLILSLRYNLK